jgi:LemA protein
MEYNTAQQTFPAVLLAASLGFRPADAFALDDPAERAVPTVSF